MVNTKIKTDVYYLSVGTRANVTPVKRIPRKKNNMKSLAMYPPRKDPIPNQYINILGAEADKSLPPQYASWV